MVPEKQANEIAHTFAPGDRVMVGEGELQHLPGKVIKVDGNKITILPRHDVLKVSFLIMRFFSFLYVSFRCTMSFDLAAVLII